MTTKSPCKNYCRYEQFEGEQVCEACGRTYDDLDVWLTASDSTKKDIKKHARERLKRLKHAKSR